MSLVELMVALAVGLLLLLGILQLMSSTSESNRQIERFSRLMDTGNYASKTLNEQIRHAGFYGKYFNRDAPPPVPSSMPDPCSTDPSVIAQALAVPIQGYDAPTGDPPPTCLNDANHLDGTDILVVRRADTEFTQDTSTLTAKEVYIQSTSINYVLDYGDSGNFTLTERDGTTTAEIRKFHVHIYFVSPCHQPVGSDCDGSADDGDPIPTLKRLELVGDSTSTSFERQPLVAGVETLQFDYGMDGDGDGVIEPPYTVDPGSVDAWADVISTKMFVLARSREENVGYSDDKTYHLGAMGGIGPMQDRYRRHVFSTLVRAVNPTGRREKP